MPLRFGTLVVFTDGTDRAHRASPEDVTRTLDGAGFETYVIGAGQEVDSKQLSNIGRSGTFASQNKGDVQKGFDEISARIEANSKRFYLLSYCSPSRAGDHEVEIEAHGAGSSGRLGYQFSASGFGPNCNPNTRPSFDMKHPRQPVPEQAQTERAPQHGGPPPAPSRGGVANTGWTPKRGRSAPQARCATIVFSGSRNPALRAGAASGPVSARARRPAWRRRTRPRRSRSG